MRRRKKTQLDRDAAAAREAGLTYGQWRAQQWEAAGRPEIRGAVVSPPVDELTEDRPKRTRKRGAVWKPENFSVAEFCRLYNAGYNDVEIARALGVTRGTVQKGRARLCVPPNWKRSGEPPVPPGNPITAEMFERP